MTNNAYRQGCDESWSTGAANPGSPAAAQFRKGRGLDRYFDRHRVADFQNEGVQGRIQKRAIGGFFAVLGSASASFGRSRLGSSQSDDRQDHPCGEPGARRRPGVGSRQQGHGAGRHRGPDYGTGARSESLERELRRRMTSLVAPEVMSSCGRDLDLARRRLQQKGDLFNQGGMWKLRWHEDKIGSDGERMRGWSRAVHIGPSAGAGKLTEKEARRLGWENFLSKLDAGVCAPHSAVTLGNFVEQRFLPDHVALLKRSGRSHYESMLKHVLPALEKLRLKDATAADIQKLASSMLGQSYSVQTVKHVRTTVSAIFTHAKRLGWHTGDNPAKLVRLPAMVRRGSHALSLHQSFSALASLQSPAPSMVLLACFTSMNIAAICGLQWKRANLQQRFKT